MIWRRLRRMGLVKADREKRWCTSRWGIRSYYKGFQYRYCLSEQGKSYLNWMDNIKPNEDFVRNELTNQIVACLPPELKKALLVYSLSKAAHKYKGPSRRFRFFDDQRFIVAILQLENQRLVEENQKLVLRSIELSDAYESKIEWNHEKDLLDLALVLVKMIYARVNVERQQSLQTINTLSQGQRILIRALGDIVKLCVDSQDLLLASLRKYAPRKEYITTLEQVSTFERSELNNMNARALSRARSDEEASQEHG